MAFFFRFIEDECIDVVFDEPFRILRARGLSIADRSVAPMLFVGGPSWIHWRNREISFLESGFFTCLAGGMRSSSSSVETR